MGRCLRARRRRTLSELSSRPGVDVPRSAGSASPSRQGLAALTARTDPDAPARADPRLRRVRSPVADPGLVGAQDLAPPGSDEPRDLTRDKAHLVQDVRLRPARRAEGPVRPRRAANSPPPGCAESENVRARNLAAGTSPGGSTRWAGTHDRRRRWQCMFRAIVQDHRRPDARKGPVRPLAPSG